MFLLLSRLKARPNNRSMDPQAQHWAIRTAPICRMCYHSSEQCHVNSGNRNGNAGRPYYLCHQHVNNNFVCFADMHGVHLDNPACNCLGLPLSRLQVRNPAVNGFGQRRLFYGCAVGGCDFYQ
ncbi:hypothetical protein BDZ85DRAFT_19638 [Elsinoe ampelina]|uniref:GRF-like zinc ribbon domain-containing protein n=1 Tax=Elsinoe ampelina TaxID=302913 RepID=A0A6A6G7A7_9PEZI|nr:hypothetical protein BDZ85DRAFT_19638 [Elsinoe ampelina]